MAEPPRKPVPPSPDSSGGLEEVERALSVLGGRHPEAVRAEREAAEARERRARLLAAESTDAARATKRRWMMIAVGVVLLGIGGAAVFGWRSRRADRDRAFATKAAPLLQAGFALLDDRRGSRIVIDAEGPGCFAVVADPSSAGSIEVTRGANVSTANGDAILCTCDAESVSVASASDLRVYRADGSDVGGMLALASNVGAGRTTIPGSEACDVSMLQDWASKGRAPAGTVGALLPASLETLGFVAQKGRLPGYPFVAIDAVADRCVVAVAGAGATLALVTNDASAPPPSPAFALCDAKGSGAMLRVTGEASVTVASVSAKRIGGVLGFREALAAAGISAPVWVRDDDRSFFAEETLRASLVPDPKSLANASLTPSAAPDARVVLVTTKDAVMYVPEGPADASFLCSPTMAPSALETLCVESKAHAWHLARPDAVGALAYGPLPYWMAGLADAPPSAALAAELALLHLARRLAARGFDPAIVEGVRENADGVDVLGRSGEDAVVVVGVFPASPWVHPYDGWELDREPKVFSLKGGDHLELEAKPRITVPPEKRRTVVFRHAAK